MQMAVSVLNRSFSTDHPFTGRSDGRPVGWKRVFVQTDNGHVLGIELGRGDNASTVKRRMQLALNVPAEESLLTYGDRILNNDLTNIRNDSPLLLTRNVLHRSSSTPCLSPTSEDVHQGDHSGPIEILGCLLPCSRMKQLLKDVEKGIKNGVDPIAINSGMGGAYYFRDIWGERVAIVKPTDEEPFAPNNPKGFVGKVLGQPGLKRSVRVGETGFREVAAYLLDHEHFANVPPTVLVKITHSVFHLNDESECNNIILEKMPRSVSKIASFQQFITHDFDASDHGTSSYSVSAVHKIGILDIRIFNTDRHAGNLLVRKLAPGCGNFKAEDELIPIDHGLCLPEALEDPYFEWIHWPQASVPFSEDELEYIAKLDPVKDSNLLRTELPMIREACLRVLILSTIFLKGAAEFGLCLAEIGEMMTRPFTGREEAPSELEVLCIEARKMLEEIQVIPSEASLVDDSTLFAVDTDGEVSSIGALSLYDTASTEGNSRSPLTKLDEALEEVESDESIQEDASNAIVHTNWFSKVSKISTSLRDIGGFGKDGPHLGRISKCMDICKKANNSVDDGSATSRSAHKLLPPSVSFVQLSDMSEEEWSVFLDMFRGLLFSAFHDWKIGTAGPRQRHRLGTSCQF